MLMLAGLLLCTAFFIDRQPIAVAAGRTERSPSNCSRQHPSLSINGTVVVTHGEIVCGDLTSFGGTLSIRGEVDGDVLMLGGNSMVSGTVHGNLTLYGSNLALRDGAQITGAIHVCGGTWTGEANARRAGSVLACTTSLGTLLTNENGTAIRIWTILASILLGLLLAALLPEHVVLVQTTVKSKLSRSFVLGLVSVLLSPAVLAILVGLIIPIPLALLVVIGLIAAWAMGTAAIGCWIGETFLGSVAPQWSNRFLQIVVGLALLGFVEILPNVGLWITIGSGLIGLGAAFLSRFGTRLYSLPRRSLLL
jgi:hypothetical protein